MAKIIRYWPINNLKISYHLIWHKEDPCNYYIVHTKVTSQPQNFTNHVIHLGQLWYSSNLKGLVRFSVVTQANLGRRKDYGNWIPKRSFSQWLMNKHTYKNPPLNGRYLTQYILDHLSQTSWFQMTPLKCLTNDLDIILEMKHPKLVIFVALQEYKTRK